MNPDGGHSNCVACCITDYLRSLGYDVTAKVRSLESTDGRSIERNFSTNEVEALFSNFKMNKLDGSSPESIKKALLMQGDGACGMVGGDFSKEAIAFIKLKNPKATISGHVFSYRVLNGEVVFSDGQNKIFGDDILKIMLGRCDADGFSYGRFDNLKIDPELIPIFCNYGKE